MIILGLHGYGRVGKDTFADALVDNHGFVKIAFADAVRDTLYALNPPLIVEDGTPAPLQQVVDALGWEEAKILYPSVRQMMIGLGEGARSVIAPEVWVHTAFRALHDPVGRVVFTDVRNLIEARALRERLGAQLVHITRPGVGPAHPSETPLPPALLHWSVTNNGDLTDLRAQADMLMFRLTEKGVA
ncbi:deoxynucleotide monophosphate kinase family protein [Streptosporangium sandarakinum]